MATPKKNVPHGTKKHPAPPAAADHNPTGRPDSDLTTPPEATQNLEKSSRAPGNTRGPERAHLKQAWLAKFREIGYVVHTCKSIGIKYDTWSQWMKLDPDFVNEFALANKDVLEKYEMSASHRAINGVDRPIYQGGKLVGHQKEYSDDLLKVMLRAKDPDKYRETIKPAFTDKEAAMIASEVLKAVRRAAPGVCPSCRTNLHLPEKIAEELKNLSAKLNLK